MSAESGRFWSRAKVSTASGVLGLMLGVGLGAAGQPTVDATNPDVKALVSAGVEKKTAALDDDADQLREQLEKARAEAAKATDASADAERQLTQAQDAVKAAQAEAKKAKEEAVRNAAAAKEAAAKAAASKPAATYGLTGTGASGSSGGSDPLFRTCGDANDNGYGNYHRGQDPEYSHYQDRDGDGVVCEF